MAKKLKRAFTITELVIVIAVVAILAAVLIPTFANIINKANESADTQTIVNMNHILGADQILDGKPNTMEAAVRAIEEGGYKVENLTPTSDGNDVVWDEEHNRLALIDEKGGVVYSEGELTADKEKIWKITDKAPANDGYSYYLAPGFANTTVVAYAGVDVGKNEDIESVKIDIPAAAIDVTVRTFGGDLVVDAPKATVRHYDDADSVQIDAIAGESYHEYGTVAGEFTVADGHVTLESGSNAGDIYVTGNGVKVDWSSDAKPQSVGVKSGVSADVQEDADVPVIKDVDEDTKNLFAGGFGTEESPYLIANENQFVQIGELGSEMRANKKFYFRLISDIDLEKVSVGRNYVLKEFYGELDGDGHTIYGNSEIEFIAYFALQEAAFRDITIQFAEKGITRMVSYVACIASSYKDSLNVTISGRDKVELSYYNVDYVGEQGLTYTMGDNNSALYLEQATSILYCWWENDYHISYNMVTIVEGTDDYVNTVFVLDGCDVSADLSGGNGASGAAIFLTGQNGDYTFVTFRNCSYTGSFTGLNVGVLFANATGSIEALNNITIENLSLYGQIISLGGKSGVTFANNKTEHPSVTQECKNRVINLTKDETLGIAGEENGLYTINAATNLSTSYYKIQLSMKTIYWYTNGYDQPWTAQTNSNYLTIQVDANNISDTGVFKAKAISKYEAGLAENASKGIGDVECNLVSEEGNYYTFAEGADGVMYLVIDYEKAGMKRMFASVDYVSASVFAYNESDVTVAFAQE